MTNPRGYDFHCHIDLYPDPEAIISACDSNRIMTLAVTTTPKAWIQNSKWASASPYVHAAVGLHPELVGTRYHELDLLLHYMKDTTLIGEVGLDASPRYMESWEHQKDVLAKVLRNTETLGGRLVSIHSRRAAKEVVQMIEELTTPDRVLCILHWFSGSKAIGRKAASLGCYFSVNSQMLTSKQGADLFEDLPADKILTETDGPFTIEQDRKSIPSDVLLTTERLAKIRNVSQSATATQLLTNAERVYRFAEIMN